MRIEAGQYVRALYDFPTSHAGEVSLQAGDVVEVTGTLDESWLRGRLLLTGQEGGFPASFVERLSLPSLAVGQRVFVAIDDFPGQESGDLSLSRGDIVTGLEAVDASWWRGKCGPLRGIFPLTLVVELQSLSSSLAPTGRQLHTPSQPPADGSSRGEEEGLARALVDTTPQLGGELGLVAGDVLTIKEVIDADWYLGECQGRQGLVPSFCVELLTDAPLPGSSASTASSRQASQGDRPPEQPPAGGGRPRQNSLMDYVYSSTGGADDSTSPASYYTSENTRSHDAEVTPYARTLYPFVAQNANELCFEENEIVTLLQHVDEDWTEGELDGKVGLFPTSFVEIIVDCPYKLKDSSDSAPQPGSSDSAQQSASSDSAQQSASNDSAPQPASSETAPQPASSDSARHPGSNDSAPQPASTGDMVERRTTWEQGRERLGLVLHHFQASLPGDLSVAEGDTLVILECLDSNWVRGRDDSGNVGLVPLNHLEVIDACPVSSPSSLSETSSLNGTESLSPTSPSVPKSSSWSDFNDNRVKQTGREEEALEDTSEQKGTSKSLQNAVTNQNQKPTRSLSQGESGAPVAANSRKPDLLAKPVLTKPKLAPKPILKSKPASLPPKPSLQSLTSKRASYAGSTAESKLRTPAFTTLDTLIGEEMRKSKEEAENRSRSSSSLSSGSRDSQELSLSSDCVKYSRREAEPDSDTPDSLAAVDKAGPSPAVVASARPDRAQDKDAAPGKVLQPEVPKRVSFRAPAPARTVPRPKSEILQGRSGEASLEGLKPSGFVNDAYSFDADELLVNTEGTSRGTAPPARPPPRPALTQSSAGKQWEVPRKPAPPRPQGPRVAAAPSKVPLVPMPASPQPGPARPAPPAPSTHTLPASGGTGRVPSRPAPPRPASTAAPRKPPPRPKTQPADLMTFSSDSVLEVSSDLNAEIIMDLRQRIEEVEKDLQKYEAVREELQQKLLQAEEEEDMAEEMADVQANVYGLTEELRRLRESLCQVSPEDERQEQQRQQREQEAELRRQQEVEARRKRREKREKVIQELLATEKDFLFSLHLCLTSFSSLADRPAVLDVDKVLGNMEEIAEVSQRLLTCLETALNGKEFEEQVVGTSFLTLAEDMKNTYAPYCRNHDEVITLMEKYKATPEVREYFARLVERMRLQSNVFDLEAQLIKPVQRVLKYPLLLNELFKVTEEEHPDKQQILQAISAITDVAGAINEYKRRKDLVYKYKRETDQSFSDKLAKINMHSIKKKSSRFRSRLSTGLGISLMTKDEKFDREEEMFRMLEKACKVFLKNVQTYLEELREALVSQESLAACIAEFYESKVTPDVQRYKAIQSKVANVLLPAFRDTAEELVVTPVNSLLGLMEGPNHVIDKRYDKLLDFDNLARKTRDPERAGELQKVRADYEAMNAQLLDELPRLNQLCQELLTTCVACFVETQRHFIDAALKELYQEMQLPLLIDSPEKLAEIFNVKHTEAVTKLSQLKFSRRGSTTRPDSRQSRPQAGDSGSAAQAEQNEGQQAFLRQRYPDRLYRVKERHVAAGQMDLDVAAGQLVAVLKEQDPMGNKERWFVDVGGEKGFIPRRVLVPDSTFVVAGSSSASEQSATGDVAPPPDLDPLEAELDEIATDPTLDAPPEVPEYLEPPEYYRALYDFQARTETEMSLRAGQRVLVLARHDKQGDPRWWEVRVDGNHGFTPGNYLERLA